MPTPLSFRPADEREQILDFRFGQRRGGLVHDEDAWRSRRKAPWRSPPSAAWPTVRVRHDGFPADVDQLHANPAAAWVLSVLLAFRLQKQCRCGLAADDRCSPPRSGRRIRLSSWWMMQMPSRLRLRGYRCTSTSCPSSVIVASVRGIDAGEDLHQRGLAGAVFPHQRVHLARAEHQTGSRPARGRRGIFS